MHNCIMVVKVRGLVLNPLFTFADLSLSRASEIRNVSYAGCSLIRIKLSMNGRKEKSNLLFFIMTYK